MRILHLSDTHSKHHLLVDLPSADVLVHSGDFSFAGSEEEAIAFIEWFASQPNKYKIFIAGNHDDSLCGANLEGLPDNCFYLCNSGITIEGVNFYGVPLFMDDFVTGDYDSNVQKIPLNTDVLISHQPPHGILDFASNIHYGDLLLLQKVLEIKPTYHLFGHIHDAYGIMKSEHISFVNASIVDEKYHLSNNPILLEM